jgi:hypothetical protein
MKFKTTILYAIILFGLGGFYYLHEVRGKKSEAEKVAEEKKALHFDPVRVKRLSLMSKDETVICVRKSKDEWTLTRPVETEADNDAINRVLDTVKELETERVIADSTALASGTVHLADYGLEIPRLAVVIEVEDTTSKALLPLDVLYFGDETPTKSFAFARKGQRSEVFTVRLWRFDNLNKKAFDLRQKRVLAFNKDDVKGLELHRKGEEAFIFNKSGESWMMERPMPAKGDQDELKGMLNRLDGERVKEFADERPTDLVQYGLSDPAITLTLWVGADRAKKTLTVGSPKDAGFYAKDESRLPVFVIDSAYVSSLRRKTVFDLRDKSLVEDFEVDDIEKVELVYPNRMVTCQKDTGSVWLVTGPSVTKGTAKTWKVRSAVSAVKRAKAKEFSPPASLTEYGLAQPTVRAVLYTKNGVKFVELMIGKEHGDGVYAKTDRGPAVYLIDKNIRDDLSPTMEDLVEKPAAAVKKEEKKG